MHNNILEDTPYNFMQYIKVPPRMVEEEYDSYKAQPSSVRVISGSDRVDKGLGQLPASSMSGESNSWVMPVVVIVVSAMALMVVYSLVSKRR
jgi:hypothetical protein